MQILPWSNAIYSGVFQQDAVGQQVNLLNMGVNLFLFPEERLQLKFPAGNDNRSDLLKENLFLAISVKIRF